ncbi:hypothetical protein OPV22_016994 [Ensete ventricosum]|uniref:Uncharacterized protein n=1 Tax=Ensete ventricosum TaxID=4639 RepID=A0AAV8QMC1_ENSVE|nr:hypothetical protein OPV22_016994 [Ensete ventricosum]
MLHWSLIFAKAIPRITAPNCMTSFTSPTESALNIRAPLPYHHLPPKPFLISFVPTPQLVSYGQSKKWGGGAPCSDQRRSKRWSQVPNLHNSKASFSFRACHHLHHAAGRGGYCKIQRGNLISTEHFVCFGTLMQGMLLILEASERTTGTLFLLDADHKHHELNGLEVDLSIWVQLWALYSMGLQELSIHHIAQTESAIPCPVFVDEQWTSDSSPAVFG